MRFARLLLYRAGLVSYQSRIIIPIMDRRSSQQRTPSEPPRRSPRFLATQVSVVTNDSEDEQNENPLLQKKPKKRSRSVKTTTTNTAEKKPRTTTKKKKETRDLDNTETTCLPRTREDSLKEYSFVMGIDEAGRGPLCGPVVTAAAIIPTNIAGITDSKQITKEEQREELFERILQSPNLRWAVAVIDAVRIDEINILQATLEGMRICAQAVLQGQVEDYPTQPEASIQHKGCYIVCGATDAAGKFTTLKPVTEKAYALIDGNRLPKSMPCEAEAIVKGDSREFSIAAASILAKVTRDRLMHAYDALYPEYDLKQNKGYPTAFHMKAVRDHGATIIHRRTFAPLKHMEMDENGKIKVQSKD
ncbi:ribonuclease HII [Fistulifera solaris]|uniref:Ribonuclease n=1 Tax=Fistulifera solaris TaxID=1519565 RepID=A0A1Z5J600_FISSO|nr:ribonuclease HII [Fistulifera solaris]|eukprot:GAX09356.1 ribonuclease HII [Fistulifera solaris]